jgi:hypothetical protein
MARADTVSSNLVGIWRTRMPGASTDERKFYAWNRLDLEQFALKNTRHGPLVHHQLTRRFIGAAGAVCVCVNGWGYV